MESNKPTLAGNTVTIPAGYGYWDITHYPWGGDFCRWTTAITGTLIKILDTYKDGSPRKVTLSVGAKIYGVEF